MRLFGARLISQSVDEQLRRDDRAHAPYIVADDMLYADDTLLVGAGEMQLQTKLKCIVEMGKAYGFE